MCSREKRAPFCMRVDFVSLAACVRNLLWNPGKSIFVSNTLSPVQLNKNFHCSSSRLSTLSLKYATTSWFSQMPDNSNKGEKTRIFFLFTSFPSSVRQLLLLLFWIFSCFSISESFSLPLGPHYDTSRISRNWIFTSVEIFTFLSKNFLRKKYPWWANALRRQPPKLFSFSPSESRRGKKEKMTWKLGWNWICKFYKLKIMTNYSIIRYLQWR